MKICYNCGDKLLDAAIKCPHCGVKDGKKGSHFYSVDRNDVAEIERIIASVPNPKSGVPKWKQDADLKTLSIGEAIRASFTNNISQAADQKNTLQAKIKQMDSEGAAYCPKCYSTSLSANKKGFGIGKAVIGRALIGGIGLTAGNIGSQKVKITCLKCGYQFNPGEK